MNDFFLNFATAIDWCKNILFSRLFSFITSGNVVTYTIAFIVSLVLIGIVINTILSFTRSDYSFSDTYQSKSFIVGFTDNIRFFTNKHKAKSYLSKNQHVPYITINGVRYYQPRWYKRNFGNRSKRSVSWQTRRTSDGRVRQAVTETVTESVDETSESVQ